MSGAAEVVQAAEAKACCAHTGPGYASPLEAMAGPREALIYVTCVYNGKNISLLCLFLWVIFAWETL